MKKKECPSCAMEINKDEKVCPICGYEFPAESRATKYLIAFLILVFAVFIFTTIL